MKEIIFNRNNYESYKDFYSQIYNDLDGENTIDWEDCNNLRYNGNLLDEFLWYKQDEKIKYIFINFDKEKIKLQKNYDDYEYNIILKVFERFVKEYPNNKLEFRMEDEKK